MGGIVGVDFDKCLRMVVVEEQGKQEEEEDEKKKKTDESESSDVVSWEEYLPKMVITVLLVEADDSTRQIIAALLRKCNYKVTAIPDGLKAWEILKQKHNNIDLILTEVDLPSISGYALLTLITEHDDCKNIPVIMMSSSDSISMAFKCMRKGAADFLIKPVRRNELKNLWHHVWRRSSANKGSGVLNLGGSHFLVEAPSTKRATENCSDDNVFSSIKYSLSTEKASHAQGASNSSHNEVQQHQKRMRLEEEIEEEKSARFETSGVERDDERYTSTLRQAIDLIGTIDDHHNCTLQQQPTSNDELHVSSTTQLDLSLRTNGVKKLNHSNASAFSRFSSNSKLRTPSLVNSFSSDEENKSSVITVLKPKNLDESSRLTSPLQSDQGTYCSSLGNSWFDETSNNEEKAVASQSGASGSVCQEKDDTKGARHASYREAALARFRQKRKDRCYEKKVRYQSRKRLAEQRPRVKGQFVSQVQMNQRALETDNGHEDEGG